MVGQHLQRHRALAGDDAVVVVGVDEGQAFLGAQGLGHVRRFGQVLALQDDPGAMGLGMPDLGEGGVPGHDDGGGHAQALGVIGDALGVVPGRAGDDARRRLRRAQPQELVERAPVLEGGGVLQVLELEVDRGPRQVRQGARPGTGRADHSTLDRLGRGADMVDGHRHGLVS